MQNTNLGVYQTMTIFFFFFSVKSACHLLKLDFDYEYKGVIKLNYSFK